jgi:hypothetical protein
MSRIERTNEKYNRAFVKELQRADKMPPEKRTSDIKALLEYLEEDEPPSRLGQPLDRNPT